MMDGKIATLSVGLMGIVLVMASGCSQKSLKYSSGGEGLEKGGHESSLEPSANAESTGEWALSFSQGRKSGPEGWKNAEGQRGPGGVGSEMYQPGVVDPANPRQPGFIGEHGTEGGYPTVSFGQPQRFPNSTYGDPSQHSSSSGLTKPILPGAIDPAQPSLYFGEKAGTTDRHEGTSHGQNSQGPVFFSSPDDGSSTPLPGDLASLPEFDYGSFEDGDGRDGWGAHAGQFSKEYLGDEMAIASVPSPVTEAGDQSLAKQPYVGLKRPSATGGAVSSIGASHHGQGLAYQTNGPSGGLQDVFFEFDRWRITPESSQVLSVDKEWLSAHSPVSVTIEGHSDLRGTQNYNLVLGRKRALAVQSYLIDLGVDPSMLKIISYGEERPFCRETTEQCYQLNRRGHLITSK